MKRLLPLLLVFGCSVDSGSDADVPPTPCRQVVECSLERGETASPHMGWEVGEGASTENACTAEMLDGYYLDPNRQLSHFGSYLDVQMGYAGHVMTCLGVFGGDPDEIRSCNNGVDWEAKCDSTDLQGVTYWPVE